MSASRPLPPSADDEDESVNSPMSDRYASIAETPPAKGDDNNADPEAPRPQSIDRLSSRGPVGPPQLPGSGLHMPPEMLGLTGQAESPSKDSKAGERNGKPRWPHIRARSAGTREKAIKSMQSQAAVAAAIEAAVTARQSVQQVALDSTIFTLLTYGGVEVIFALTADMTVLGVCSRTHMLFQTLRLASDAPVVSITSNSSSGLLIVAHKDGTLKSYRPVPANRGGPTPPNSSKHHLHIPFHFGKYHWIDCSTIHAAKTFYQPDEPPDFCDRRTAEPGQLIDVSSSADNKLLVAHKNQLAVFEAAHVNDTAIGVGTGGRLLWTTLLPSNIVTAKLSGDGQAVVVVIAGDEDNDGSYGARTFVHDMEDGSLTTMTDPTRPPLERSNSVGVVFKPGPFLKHSTPVTRVSFRGFGRNTSSTSPAGDEGNDLLLTFCDTDSTIRIFNQNGWKQLMQWAAPPNSRADWIRGSSAFSLGDLESEKKAKIHGSRAPSRRPSGSSDLSAGAGIKAGLRNATPLGSASPSTGAGAWIAEITFRGAFPALRLSRLSYIKRGNDDFQPAHFESVAAILPPGSITAASVLKSDDMGLAIQGIWPAWNPWLSEPTGSYNSDTSTGSAMQFLGLSSVPPPHTQFFGDSYLGGTHSPPTELRIVASHPTTGSLVVMEFPLWGDDDFGAMELGSPLRSVLSLSGIVAGVGSTKEHQDSLPYDSTDYDSSRLCAQINPGQRSISLLWKRQGSQSLISPRPPHSVVDTKGQFIPQWMEDMSAVSVPLSLPPLRLPNGTASVNRECITAIKWWPDEGFDGPPLLLALTQSTTLVVFEIPPPRSIREPAMPNFDPFNVSSNGSVGDPCGDSGSDYEDDFDSSRQEYEVNVTPHPDFGLGLRLESPMDGLPAVAGSFKKHPLNGGMLPAEKTGMIVLGDELLSVNGVSLENLTFDDIIATVRHVGAKAGPGHPLVLGFRPAPPERQCRNSAVVHESFNVHTVENIPSAESDAAINRRSVMGVSPKVHRKRSSSHRKQHSDGGSLASMLVGSFGEAQQEFGRVIAVIRKAVPSLDTIQGFKDHFVAIPWGNGFGVPSSGKTRGVALLVFAYGTKVYARRLELPYHPDPEKTKMTDLGSVDLDLGGEALGSAGVIKSIQPVPFGGQDRCFVVVDSRGGISVLFVNTKDRDSDNSSRLGVIFRQYKVFDLGKDSTRILLRAPSIDIFATHDKDQNDGYRAVIKVWNARYDPSCRQPRSEHLVKDEYFDQSYIAEEIEVLCSDSSSMEVVDFFFLKTGYLDSFPPLVVFLQSEAVVYQRRVGQRWVPIQRISFPKIPSSDGVPESLSPFALKPEDRFPHFLPMVHSTLSSADENSYLLSDWHPEALLAHLCIDERGAKIAMKEYVQKVLTVLSEVVETSENPVSSKVPLLVAPLRSIGGKSLVGNDFADATNPSAEKTSNTAASLFNKDPIQSSGEDEVRKKVDRLLAVLELPRGFRPPVTSEGKSREFLIAMSHDVRDNDYSQGTGKVLTSLLSTFSPAQLRVLWAIADVVRKSPQYGKLDTRAQFALTVFSLHTSLKQSPSDTTSQTVPTSPYSKSTMQSFYLRRKSSSGQEKSVLPPQSASAGSVSALLSDYQGQLLAQMRDPSKKLDWATVREFRVPFWLRSDEKLRQISEEVGQNLYRESRDILKAAIFFLAAGKSRTLRNLSAADSTESGKKFFKFLTSFDFSSERGRSAAEKNAFSLLRKNKYDCAAAFFLLAEPPILKPAVETIASKMEDLDLAFMVARLVGGAQAKVAGHGGLGFGGTGSGFGGVIGGGGGYVGPSAIFASVSQKDEETFDQWRPRLNTCAQDLIVDRALSSSYEDSSFCALLLMWLRRNDEAWLWLSGFVECHDSVLPDFVGDARARRLSESTEVAKRSQDPTIVMVNLFINFASGPSLLKAMNAAARTRIASALLVSTSLCRIGVDIPALLSVTHAAATRENDPPHADHLNPTPKSKPSAKTMAREVPSIFDAFSAPVQRNASSSSGAAMPSSIFDTFDVPYINTASNSAGRPPGIGNEQSSIFDAFDIPQKIDDLSSGLAGGAMTSSIFDSFDAPLPPKKNPTAHNAEASSSIFDSYDVAPTTKTPHGPSSGALQSSVFDAFDAPTTIPLHGGNNLSPAVAPSDPEETPTPFRGVPELWSEMRSHILVKCAARRMVREVASIGSRFHVDFLGPVMAWRKRMNEPLIPSSASQTLQLHADGIAIVSDSKACLLELSAGCGVDETLIVDGALQILDAPYHCHRVCVAVLLHLAADQTDRAEDVVRKAAYALIQKCTAFSFSNDDISVDRQSGSSLSTLFQRQTSAYLSWQLELCLWMHRGGALPLSALALNETICAVRIGMLIASWNSDFEVLETMIRHPPDCSVDESVGRQLWTSLKIITNSLSTDKKTGAGSGGWEFLVDCRRAEATEMLRPRSTGSFIIRPHPEDHGVFTLSFKTNLKPIETPENEDAQDTKHESEGETKISQASTPKSIRRDDVVQHAIIRLSDSGFRCGSFGPFATLMKLLEAVSSSLPFNLRFDQPPTDGVIKEEGMKPSPNSAFFRKLALAEVKRLSPGAAVEIHAENDEGDTKVYGVTSETESTEKFTDGAIVDTAREDFNRRARFGIFCELLVLSELRRQLSSVAAAKYDNCASAESNDSDSVGSITEANEERGPEEEFAVASRILWPLLTWCRMKEIQAAVELAPPLQEVAPTSIRLPVALKESETAIEISTAEGSAGIDGGDAVIRRMIQPGSGVGFRTLRLGEGGESAMVVLFSKSEAMDWLLKNGVEKSEEDAMKRLQVMEIRRVIEPVDLKLLAPKAYNRSKQGNTEEEVHLVAQEVDAKGIRYRLVDPWEVEPLDSREAETKSASLGRHRFLAFDLGKVATSCENVLRSLGGLYLLELWAAASGGVTLTKAIATVHPPWERGSGGDLQLRNGTVAEPVAYDNSIRQHLYRNALFRRLDLPQRFMALIQVELLDLKNLTSPGGSLSLTVYSLLRLKRPRSTAPLTIKARTLDSVATHPTKLGKATGPNAPASWGSLVRFRFPLPEHTAADGRSYDMDREALFKGPPSVLQVSVYEKKFMSDTLLGGADIKLDGLSSGGQLEEWVPLRTETHGINWFARIRLTLRFELMCLSPENEGSEDLDYLAPSVGLKRIQQLSSIGGVQEDVRKSVSTPDLLSYFESMVY